MNPRWWPVVAVLGGLGGCFTWPMSHVGPEETAILLPHLEPGRTSRNDVLRMLGKPSFESATERVVAYRMAWARRAGLFSVERDGTYGWGDVDYNLILAFDAADVLEKRVLIQMKKVDR